MLFFVSSTQKESLQERLISGDFLTSIQGIVTDTCRSLPPLDADASIIVIQWELSIFWAGSWPVAINTAETILDAWALKPPMAPASADPVKFLSMFNSNKAGTVVFKTLLTTASVMTASHTTDFPRPSIQFTTVGFLSAQKLPDDRPRKWH